MITSTFTATILAEDKHPKCKHRSDNAKTRMCKGKGENRPYNKSFTSLGATTDIERSDVATSHICVPRKRLIMYQRVGKDMKVTPS